MTFGPYKLLDVRIEGTSLVLDLGDENGQPIYHPRRFISFGDSQRIQEEATKLIGSMVVTETANEAKNPPKNWWKSVCRHTESTVKQPPVRMTLISREPDPTNLGGTGGEAQPIEVLTLHAESGNADSQFKLGAIYDAGKVVPRDLIKAMEWYQTAAAQGHLLARRALGLPDASNGNPTLASEADGEHVTKIYGPPGTGKTRTLLKLVQKAIAKGVSPDMIGFFSFTNKATEEAKSRMIETFPQYDIGSDFPYFRTIHSLANQSLRTRVKVISDTEALEFDKDVIVERPFMREGDESSQVVRVKHPVLDAATTARSLKVSFKEYLRTMPPTRRWPLNKWLRIPRSGWTMPFGESGIHECLSYEGRYEEYKKTLGVIDYADMLDRAVIDKMSLPKLKLLLVDEAQDLSPVQWDLVKALIALSESCFIAGDDDQAICESFGASAKEFINLPGSKKSEIFLGKSNRVPPTIHQALTPLIARLDAKYPYRMKKNWKPKDNGVDGIVGHFNDVNDFLKKIVDVESIKNGTQTLLMFATNASLKKISDILLTRKIVHYAANKLVGVGPTDIRLFTIWGAKGGEAEVTALIALSDMDMAMLSEDPRLEYVAHTRAKESFYYVGPFVEPTPKPPAAPPKKFDALKQSATDSKLSPDSLPQLLGKFG